MWFKRRKKSEQDHALSQSLKSLQTLLNDTGRVEPSLERPDSDAGREDAGSDEPRRRPRLSSREDSNGTEEERGDVRLGNPSRASSGTSDSGNRWQDLNLSFDAEPVAPRPRRGSEDDEQSRDQPSEDEPASPEAATAAPAEPEAADETGGGENEAAAAKPPAPPAASEPESGENAEQHEHAIIEDYGSRPRLAPAPDAGAGEVSDQPSALDLNEFAGPNPGEPELEIDLGMEEAAAAEAKPVEAPGSGDVPGEVEGEVEEIEMRGPPDDSLDEDAPEAEPTAGPAPAPAEEREEDQLHLELESTAANDDDIPTLTDAIYVPDEPVAEAPAPQAAPESRGGPESPVEPESQAAPDARAPTEPQAESETPRPPEPEQTAPPEPEPVPPVEPEPPPAPEPGPGPDESPYDRDIERCLEQLRVRLQLMGLGVLSPAQEKELHDTLVEFLDER